MSNPRETMIKAHDGVLIVYRFSYPEEGTIGIYAEDTAHGVTTMLTPEQVKALRKALKP